MTVDSPTITPDSLQAEICRRSFLQFVKRFWHIVITEPPKWNWHVEVICEELQIVAERIFKGQDKLYDLVINVPPGSTKSTLVSIMWPAWCWTRMTHFRTIGASHTHTLALDHSRKGRLIVKSDLYQKLFGENAPEPQEGEKDNRVLMRDDQNTKQFYETTTGGDRHAVGTGGLIIGFHGHALIGDDLIDPKGARSEADIKFASEWVRETYLSRKVDKRVAVFVLIMQRLAEGDPTGMILQLAKENPKSYKIRHICLPDILNEHVSPPRMRLKYIAHKCSDGETREMLDPARISWEAICAAKAELGPFGYAGQYGQWPVPPEGGMFKIGKIRIGIPPPTMKFHRIVRYWDKAGTEGFEGAETSGTKMAEYIEFAGGKISVRFYWILDVIHGRWDSGERERIILQTAQADGRGVIVCVEQEPGSGGKESAQATVRNLAGFTIGKDKVTGDKISRADPLSIQVNEGNVCVVQGAAWWPYLRDQMALFPFGKLKDCVDSTSGAFAVITNRVKVGALGGRR
jgi:predicted phage terminase large subunit-like protein